MTEKISSSVNTDTFLEILPNKGISVTTKLYQDDTKKNVKTFGRIFWYVIDVEGGYSIITNASRDLSKQGIQPEKYPTVEEAFDKGCSIISIE
jgi:hypothetical protein